MKAQTLLCFLLLTTIHIIAQPSLYFPPIAGTWETTEPSTLNWCEENLDDLKSYLDTSHSKAFILLQDGKIVLEWYFDSFTRDSTWYWASAGKSLAAYMTGVALSNGDLSLNDKVSEYLGSGWTSLDSSQENAIEIIHQLTMTTGLDDGLGDSDCTDPICLQFKADAGTRWAYHNAPYLLLRPVLEAATGKNFTVYYLQNIGNKIGAGGFWFNGNGNLFFSKPRDMARFGLLSLANGQWNGQIILNQPDYVTNMVQTSQSLNQAYGYLWWLNGKQNYLLPGTQFQFNGSLIPSAPDDMYAALGKNDQKVYVVPSQNRVVIRMGDAAEGVNFALSAFDETLWNKIENLACTSVTSESKPIQTWVQSNAHGLEIIDQSIIKMGLFEVNGQLIQQYERPNSTTSNWNIPILLSTTNRPIILVGFRKDGSARTKTIIR